MTTLEMENGVDVQAEGERHCLLMSAGNRRDIIDEILHTLERTPTPTLVAYLPVLRRYATFTGKQRRVRMPHMQLRYVAGQRQNQPTVVV